MDRNKAKRKVNKKKFILDAIHKLRKPDYLGIHVVFSGFNEAFRDYYNEDPIEAVEKLVLAGIIIKQPIKGGVVIYDSKEYKQKGVEGNKKLKGGSKETIQKILS